MCQCWQVLRERLLAEAEASVQLNAEVAGRWGKLFRSAIPTARQALSTLSILPLVVCTHNLELQQREGQHNLLEILCYPSHHQCTVTHCCVCTTSSSSPAADAARSDTATS